MTTSRTPEGDGMAGQTAGFRGNDRVLFGIVPGVLTFGLFPQTTLNIPPDVVHDVGLGASMMNTAVAMTALFSGIFMVVIGGRADRMGRVRVVRICFYEHPRLVPGRLRSRNGYSLTGDSTS